MIVTDSSLILRTPICQMRFTVDSSGEVTNRVPGSQRVVVLPDNESRDETRVVGVDVEITRFALRASRCREGVRLVQAGRGERAGVVQASGSRAR